MPCVGELSTSEQFAHLRRGDDGGGSPGACHRRRRLSPPSPSALSRDGAAGVTPSPRYARLTPREPTARASPLMAAAVVVWDTCVQCWLTFQCAEKKRRDPRKAGAGHEAAPPSIAGLAICRVTAIMHCAQPPRKLSTVVVVV
ncbi:hypothetical protein HPB50_021621 [Hyalomma asiaticum]|uniref:Uncharacterized protein n=1 Tax=Hyalomma asiaticum TaxID=266040 RepID=A0ACB7T1D2_HYAAI|nr:hypothetical protein HPB50_021621 [Hyalomma asiaticum]